MCSPGEFGPGSRDPAVAGCTGSRGCVGRDLCLGTGFLVAAAAAVVVCACLWGLR